jgi:hypothetical protein
MVTPPSPIVHVTEVGVATAVALTVPTDAVTEKGCQMPASIHSHVARLTTDRAEGSNWDTGVGSRSDRSACRATEYGSIAGVPAEVPSGIHSVWVVLAPVDWFVQVTEYQLPGVGPPGANPASSFKVRIV